MIRFVQVHSSELKIFSSLKISIFFSLIIATKLLQRFHKKKFFMFRKPGKNIARRFERKLRRKQHT